MRPNPQETADLVTFTEKICNGKLDFLCSAACDMKYGLKWLLKVKLDIIQATRELEVINSETVHMLTL